MLIKWCLQLSQLLVIFVDRISGIVTQISTFCLDLFLIFLRNCHNRINMTFSDLVCNIDWDRAYSCWVSFKFFCFPTFDLLWMIQVSNNGLVMTMSPVVRVSDSIRVKSSLYRSRIFVWTRGNRHIRDRWMHRIAMKLAFFTIEGWTVTACKNIFSHHMPKIAHFYYLGDYFYIFSNSDIF